MSNFLELNFNEKNLTPVEGGMPEWIGGNNYYKVKINTNEQIFDYFHIILADGVNKQVLEVGIATLENFAYIGKFYVPRILGNNTKVNLGIIAKKTNENNAIVSAPLTIMVKNGIAQPDPFVLDEEDINNSGFVSLLNLLETGKVLEDVTIVEKVVNGRVGQYLFVQLKTQSGTEGKYLGPLTQDLIKLGAQVERKDEAGGGGKIGYGSNLIFSQSGFAGGYNATAGVGAAVGAEARCGTGVAIGFQAKNYFDKGGIAIGDEVEVDSSSKNSVAIGDFATVTNSLRSILISSVTLQSKKGTIQNSERSIGLGYSTNIKSGEDAVVIGTNSTYNGILPSGFGTKTLQQDGVVIGREAKGTLSGSVAIGSQAKVGYSSSSDSATILQSNKNDEKDGLGLSGTRKSFGGIAIGRETLVKRGGGIAIGRFAKSYGSNSISIGSQSSAGTGDYNYSGWSKEEEATSANGMFAIAIGANGSCKGKKAIAIGTSTSSTGASSIAIGTGAEASGEGAVQIGKGKNSKDYSLKFRDIYIVKDGKLQTGTTSSSSSSSSTTKVTHPLKKILAGNHTVIKLKDLSSDAKKSKPSGLEQTVEFKPSGFSSVPNVTCTLKSSTTSVPYNFGLVITEITKTGFKYKIFADPSYKSSSDYRLGVQWMAVEV